VQDAHFHGFSPGEWLGAKAAIIDRYPCRSMRPFASALHNQRSELGSLKSGIGIMSWDAFWPYEITATGLRSE